MTRDHRHEQAGDDSPSVAGRLTRRELLQGTGVLIVGFTMSEVFPAVLTAQGPVPPARGQPIGVDSYLRVARDGSVTILTGHIDMGTGIFTAMRQCIADELDVSIEQTAIIGGDTEQCPDGGFSVASFGMRYGVQPLRVAAASARKRLFELASARLSVPTDQLMVRDGIVSVATDASRRVAYGDLIGDRRFDIRLEVAEWVGNLIPVLKIPAGVTLKTPEQSIRTVGQSIPRFDVPERVIQGKFCQNVRVPGMLHARMVRPAKIRATVVSVDESSVKGLPGFVKVVVKGNVVGVVCEREEQAIRAATRLKVTWSNAPDLPTSDDLFRALRTQPPDPGVSSPHRVFQQGDVDAALTGAARTIKATYEYPYNSHAMMAPTVAVADIQNGRGTIWTGSQVPRHTQREVAGLLGIPSERLRVIWVEEAGSYGRLAAADAAADAALLSQAVGRPVRVQWSRLEEQSWAPFQPPLVSDLTGGLDGAGNLVAWDEERWTIRFESYTRGEHPRGNLLAARLNGIPAYDDTAGPTSNNPLTYDLPNIRSLSHSVAPVMFRGLFMRMPGSVQSTFAYESFLDELAAAAGVDPVEYRLRYLKEPRGIRALKAAAERSGWQTRPSPRPGAATDSATVVSGRGICVRGYSNTWAAMVVEVEVNRATGEVRVTRVVPALDCQMIVNPDGLANQMEQATVQGISRALMEEVTFDQAKVTSVDWRTHPILTFSQVPKVDLVALNTLQEPRSGAGETCTGPTAAAIGNAIFDATGVRVRRIPFTPARIKAALEAART